MKFEGHQVNIPIKGIMRAGTDNLAADGAMNEVIGMEFKDGSWLPYKENEEEWEVWKPQLHHGVTTWVNIEGITDVYIHKTSDNTSHLLFLVTALSGTELYYQISVDQENHIIRANWMMNGVKDISFVGNMLCVAADDGLKNFMWKSSGYVAINESTFPRAELRTELGFMYKGQKLLGVLYQNIQGDRTARVRDLFGQVVNGDLLSSEKNIIISTLTAAEGKLRERGGLSGYFFAVIGFRIKNNDIVCPYPPVLLGRPNAAQGTTADGYREFCTATMSEYFPRSSGDPVKLYSLFAPGQGTGGLNGQVGDASLHFLYKKAITSQGWATEMPGESTIKLKYIEIVDEDDQPTGEITSDPRVYANLNAQRSIGARAMVPDLNMTRIVYDKSASGDDAEIQYAQICDYTYAGGNGLSMKIESLSSEQRENISSVCVFITQDVSIFKNYDKADEFDENFYQQSGYVTNNPSGGFGHRVFKYVPSRKKEETVIDELKRLNTFYLVNEIPIDVLDEYTDWKMFDLSERLGENLVLQEQLPLTSFLHNNSVPEYISAYNMRLHQYNYRQVLFDGYSIQECAHNGGLGQYNDSLVLEHVFNEGQENEYTRTYMWEMMVSIKDNAEGNSSVVRYSQSEMETIVNTLSPLIIYPDDSADSMTINVYVYDSRGASYNEKHSTTLKMKHDWLSGISYYIDPELKPIIPQTLSSAPPLPTEVPTFDKENNIRHYANGLKVSDVAFPTFFPAAYTYRIGNEAIIGLARLTTPVSQDNFGNNQLIVFCTDGIYAMTVDTSGNGAYTSIPPQVSPEICVNRNSICEIGGAVFFAGDKGLMILTGDNQVQQYAPHLNGQPRFLPAALQSKEASGIYKKMIDSTQILSKEDDAFADSISTSDFAEFIKDENTHLIYISNKNKLLAYNKNYDYSYFIDIPTHNTTKLAMSAFGDNNDLIGRTVWESDGSSYKIHTFGYLSKDDDEISCLVQSRPIKVQQDDKNSYRVVLTGYFDGLQDNWADLIVLGSLDGDHWRVIGVKEKKLYGGFHNIGCLTERGTWKYLMFIFGGKLSSDSHIDSVDITIDGRYNNKKR